MAEYDGRVYRIFARIRPCFIQTMGIPVTSNSMKASVSPVVSIPPQPHPSAILDSRNISDEVNG